MALTKVDDRGLKTPIDLLDNEKIRFGTGNDLEIYHNTVNYIDSASTQLRIDTDVLRLRTDAGEHYLEADANAAVKLYYDNSKKFETLTNGVRVTGQVDVNGGGISLEDNRSLLFGASDDLQIYHDGSHSYLKDAGTGTLRIEASEVGILSADGSETMAQFVENGATSLRHNNSTKFATTSSGVDITGNCTITGNFRGNDGVMLNLGNGDDLQIYHDGTDDHIDSGSTNSMIIASKYLRLMNQAANETMAKFTENGAVELNYDNSKKFETRSGGVGVFGHLEAGDDNKVMLGDANDLQIYHASNNNYVDIASGQQLYFRVGGSGNTKFYVQSGGAQFIGSLYGDDNNKIELGNSQDLKMYHDGTDSFIQNTTGVLKVYNHVFEVKNDAGNETILRGSANAAVELYYNNTLRFYTNSDAVTMRGGGDHRCEGNFRPWQDNVSDLGTSSDRWDDVYATNGTIQTSDRNGKNTIIDSDLGLSFVNKLKPVSYKFNNKTRTHYGLIAQDVEKTLSDINKPTTNFAGFIKENIPDKLYVEDDDIPEGKEVGDVKTAAYTTYGLRYGEFISPLIKAVQELSAEVETLETKVAALEAK